MNQDFPSDFIDALDRHLKNNTPHIPLHIALEYADELDESIQVKAGKLCPVKGAIKISKIVDDQFCVKGNPRESLQDVIHQWLMDIDNDYRRFFQEAGSLSSYVDLKAYWENELIHDYKKIVDRDECVIFIFRNS